MHLRFCSSRNGRWVWTNTFRKKQLLCLFPNFKNTLEKNFRCLRTCANTCRKLNCNITNLLISLCLSGVFNANIDGRFQLINRRTHISSPTLKTYCPGIVFKKWYCTLPPKNSKILKTCRHKKPLFSNIRHEQLKLLLLMSTSTTLSSSRSWSSKLGKRFSWSSTSKTSTVEGSSLSLSASS